MGKRKRKWEYGIRYKSGWVFNGETPMTKKQAKLGMVKSDTLVRRRITDWETV